MHDSPGPGEEMGSAVMAAKLQNKHYSNTQPCTRCLKGSRVQPAVSGVIFVCL
ncbi:MAG: hypothetical protein P1P80_10335 [ANME-2 cluster archaeon]|nr:hypothetical protein [ANME-2 cluster archaeon]